MFMVSKQWRKAAAVALLCAVVVIPSRAFADPGVPGDGGWADAGGPAPIGPAGAPAGYGVTGVDVSSHDHASGDIDWPGLAASGVKFAYVKATEGTTYTNPYFAQDYQRARNAGLFVGAYAFGRPDHGNPVGQADYLVSQSLWTADSQTLVPFLDIEWPYPALHLGSCWNMTPAALSGWIRAFVTEVQARIGRPPMIYTNSHWWDPCTGRDGTFGGYPLDIAAYTAAAPVLPAGWSTFAVWQYAGGDSGAPGVYDRDVINGDVTALTLLAGAHPPAVVTLHAHANGRFVTAESGGAAPLIANRWAIGSWEQFDLVPLGGGQVALRSHADGRYVTAEHAGAAPLIANRMAVGSWERFLLVHNADGSVSLKAMVNGRYVTAEGAGSRSLIANRRGIGTWERFDEVPPPTVVSLRARINGRYVTAEHAGAAPLIANRLGVGTWERFDRFDLGNGYIALRAHANGLVVTADRAGTAPLIANRTSVAGWEMFRLVPNVDGSVSLRALANGRYVTADRAGTAPLIANRVAIGSWEKFDLG